ncbi:alpha/beta fold hydrolase [Burkholderia plantarii]|uniref:alpha/beta fold hydrolase n=1 Tax=Burkholderia plantarii TaxID=41899 RepID=UPI0018DE7DAC|nr:alpha/beta hydrolase [Burkholderia plantarii]MBI0328592.1 alpha/beta hydrolase [Burkholderia plantarii]
MPILARAQARLYYEVHGAGYPLFLVHGGAGNSLSWYQQVPYFAKRYKVIVVDLRGFKHSACEPGHGHPRWFADDLQAVMDAEGHARAAFVCQSLGAWGALPLAVRSPGRVACLYLNGSTTPVYSDENWRVLRIAGEHLSGERTGPGGPGDPVGWNRALAAAHPAQRFLAAQIRQLNGPFDARSMQDDSVKLHAADLARYRTPTLVAGGAHDDFLTPTHHLHVAGLIPGALAQTFDDAGHSAYLETPEAFNLAVDAFVSRHTGAGA